MRIEQVYFNSILPDHIKQEDQKVQMDCLMSMAANALAREILELDGAITIHTDYDIQNRRTRITHKVCIGVE